MTADNLHLLPWNNIYLRTNKSTKGKLPKWFSQLIVKLNNKTISEKWPHLNLPQTNYFLNTLEYFSPNNPKNNLICYYHLSNTQLYF